MIGVEPNERQSAKVGDIPGSVDVPQLEEWTGADFIVSPLEVPMKTLPLLKVHLRAGAMLIQRKSGLDLVSSFGERTGTSIWKMGTLVARPAQKCLLFIGVMTCDHDGHALIDSRPAQFQGRPVTYMAADATLRHWRLRGGVTHQLCRDTLLPLWLKRVEVDLKDALKEPEVWVQSKIVLEMPNPNDPLKMPMKIVDARLLLASLPGMGPKTINSVWEWCGGDVGLALEFLTSEASYKIKRKPYGVGNKTILNIRTMLGLEAGVYLGPLKDGRAWRPQGEEGETEGETDEAGEVALTEERQT